MAPRVLISDSLSPAALAIFKERGVEVDFQPDLGKDKDKLAAIIDSMTPGERQYPAIIKASRKVRIANGSGTQVQDVNKLLKQFLQMQKMMKKMTKKGALKNLMRGMRGQMPPGFPMQ